MPPLKPLMAVASESMASRSRWLVGSSSSSCAKQRHQTSYGTFRRSPGMWRGHGVTCLPGGNVCACTPGCN